VNEDTVERLVAKWNRELPELPTSAMATIGRLLRAAALIERKLASPLAELGLNGGEFDVLATLRRSGAPYRLTPTTLAQNLMLSSGAMTNRLDRLEARALIRRLPDPDDRRGTLIELTSAGRELVESAVATHAATEELLLGAALSNHEREALDTALRTLLAGLEGERG